MTDSRHPPEDFRGSNEQSTLTFMMIAALACVAGAVYGLTLTPPQNLLSSAVLPPLALLLIGLTLLSIGGAAALSLLASSGPARERWTARYHSGELRQFLIGSLCTLAAAVPAGTMMNAHTMQAQIQAREAALNAYSALPEQTPYRATLNGHPVVHGSVSRHDLLCLPREGTAGARYATPTTSPGKNSAQRLFGVQAISVSPALTARLQATLPANVPCPAVSQIILR